MKRPSQNDQILALLSGGEWVGHHEIYALSLVGHSRISELRSRGYDIKQRRVTIDGKPIWEYRLISQCPSGSPALSARPVQEPGNHRTLAVSEVTTQSETPGGASSGATFPYLGSDTTEQLTLDAA